MEFEETRSEDRARKRRKKGVHGRPESLVSSRKPGSLVSSRKVVGTRSKALVGRYVRKEFVGIGVFLGKVVSYSSGLYRIDYEDGDCEDLDSGEIRDILLGEGDFDRDLNARKEKLDQLISVGDTNATNRRLDQNVGDSANGFNEVEAYSISKLGSDHEKDFEGEGVHLDEDADSSSDSCEYVRVCNSGMEIEHPSVPPPALPPSSGNICVPEESVSHLFSVYCFLRSFSIQLFLSPFGLDDFVGSLNCVIPNTLLDAIHVALLRALRRHLEMLSSNGAELASKCLRRIDWSLLDSLTWPVYLVEYFLVMGYTKGLDWKGFYDIVIDREYYTLSVAKKLMILQILCNNVIESAELRAEIDTRENSEVGTDFDGPVSASWDNVPRRVHPRYSKTSACKDAELMEISSETHEVKSTGPDGLMGSKVSELDTNAADLDQDGNSDECRLCGMDGTLICCDGCPSAYHSRCIGLNKMHLPEGSWFCPECTINKMASTLHIGTGLRGGEIFGIDPYEQVFLGTCNHLLVLNASMNTGAYSRYYSPIDIPKVLQVLCSSVEHKNLYMVICNGIIKYWKISQACNYSLPVKTETATYPADEKEEAMVSTPLFPFSGKKTCKLMDTNDGENSASSLTENNVGNATLSCPGNDCQETGFNCTSFITVSQVDSHSLKKDDYATTQLVGQLENNKLHEQLGTESTVSNGSVSLLADPSDLNNQSLADKSILLETATCTSGNRHGPKKENGNGVALPTTSGPLSMVSESTEGKHGTGVTSKVYMIHACSYMGSNFKTQTYVNQYVLGDTAASAAANLAVLSSEESRVSESNALSNARKFVSANVSLQMKAFSSAVFRFFWPNSEKKLMEVPRERCGWCLSCKAPITSKKGCLLNLAASNALRGAARVHGGLRPIKNGKGNLPDIAAYILYMEESLSGLTVGPFLNLSYRRQWHKKVERATTCTVLKLLLLELEEHIRVVALSGAWFKLVDDWSAESFVAPRTMCSGGSTQKRGAAGRRSRKQSATSVITVDPNKGTMLDVNWWRGGKLSKMVFQRGILPCSIAKKAARQGGSRKISGIYYAEGSEIPRRSRQFAWRAAVEMSKNASQLALQVRYLDLHVRWSDLVCPDQSLQDAKGSEAEASAFRNALVCDKKVHERKITYGLQFPNQKHLSSRVMKNIIETEPIQNGQEKFWFSEFHIPVYLIKEYEEEAEKALVANKDSHIVSKLQRRQLKALRRDIFYYLMLKGDNLDKNSCISCHKDVLFRNMLKCSACQGYCHKECTMPATDNMKDELEFLVLCSQCHHANALVSNENSKNSMISQVFQPEDQIPVIKGTQQNGYDKSLLRIRSAEMSASMKPSARDTNSVTKSRRGALAFYGLIKKKKKENTETGADFRANNLLLKGSADMKPSLQPICHLCREPYNSDLMYIRCESCRNWYHADAVQLDESQIFDVVGFRCCRCRRKSSPLCPYMNHDRYEGRSKASKRGISATSTGLYSQQPVLHTQMEEVTMEEDDSLIFSLERVVPITESTSEVACEWNTAGVQKLPVRRQAKHEKIMDASSLNPSQVEPNALEANIDSNDTDKGSSSQVKWELPVDGFIDDMFDFENMDYDKMDFEPQTYFSFTELLASEDNQLDFSDAPVDVAGNWDNSSGYGAITSYNVQEQYITDNADKSQELAAVEPVVDTVPCKQCLQTEPAVNLCCEVCGIWIHNFCSPWVEPSLDSKWRCGSCRDWR
ncbi:DDT domain-containing protein PTM-like isoform X2 [Macadamia integrifolia]|uniref:DDT domain-containing protein PTM-like isoform X2 n=1 Tax=Macadamia integrifolia TaxID=60698 RepID=UPI001C4EE61C|nr:DDT domain-containing protein PTM-like isoform X2 [Macadamia integrifolia]